MCWCAEFVALGECIALACMVKIVAALYARAIKKGRCGYRFFFFSSLKSSNPLYVSRGRFAEDRLAGTGWQKQCLRCEDSVQRAARQWQQHELSRQVRTARCSPAWSDQPSARRGALSASARVQVYPEDFVSLLPHVRSVQCSVRVMVYRGAWTPLVSVLGLWCCSLCIVVYFIKPEEWNTTAHGRGATAVTAHVEKLQKGKAKQVVGDDCETWARVRSRLPSSHPVFCLIPPSLYRIISILWNEGDGPANCFGICRSQAECLVTLGQAKEMGETALRKSAAAAQGSLEKESGRVLTTVWALVLLRSLTFTSALCCYEFAVI